MGAITFSGNKAVTNVKALRGQFAIKDGDWFNATVFGKGLQNLQKAYGQLGYINFVSLDNPSDATPASLTSSVGNLAKSSANSMGFYANDTISFTPQWKFVTGLRWDRFDAEIHNSTSLPATAKQDAHFTSVREGLLYQPDEDQSYYLSYGTSIDPLLEQMTLPTGSKLCPRPKPSRMKPVRNGMC